MSAHEILQCIQRAAEILKGSGLEISGILSCPEDVVSIGEAIGGAEIEQYVRQDTSESAVRAGRGIERVTSFHGRLGGVAVGLQASAPATPQDRELRSVRLGDWENERVDHSRDLIPEAP